MFGNGTEKTDPSGGTEMLTDEQIIEKTYIRHSEHSFTRQRDNSRICALWQQLLQRGKKEQKCLLPGLPAPPCASMQPRRECPAVQHTGIADSRGGEKGIGEERECVCVCMCVGGSGRTGEGAGWDEKTPADVSPPMTAPPSLLVCSRFPRQVMWARCPAQSTCFALAPSELSDRSTASQRGCSPAQR